MADNARGKGAKPQPAKHKNTSGVRKRNVKPKETIISPEAIKQSKVWLAVVVLVVSAECWLVHVSGFSWVQERIKNWTRSEVSAQEDGAL